VAVAREPAVASWQLLERRDLAGRLVEHADREQVAAIGHPVDPREPLSGVRSIRPDDVEALDGPVGQPDLAAVAVDDRATGAGSDHQQPDPRMVDQALDEVRPTLLEVLQR